MQLRSDEAFAHDASEHLLNHVCTLTAGDIVRNHIWSDGWKWRTLCLLYDFGQLFFINRVTKVRRIDQIRPIVLLHL